MNRAHLTSTITLLPTSCYLQQFVFIGFFSLIFFHHPPSDGPVMEVTSQFLYRGTYTDYENTFQRKVETPVEVHLSSTKVLRSKEWFHLNVDLLNKTLTF